MAKTKTKPEEIKVEYAVASLENENVILETVDVAAAKPARIRPIMIIAKTSVPFRRMANLESKYIVGQMPAGTAYEIVKEVKSRVYGEFYLLNNGYYVTKDGNYTIS